MPGRYVLQIRRWHASLLIVAQGMTASHVAHHRLKSASQTKLKWPDSLDFNAVVTLNDGNTMSVEGFGTFRMAPGNETYTSVRAALDMGYRMIDTAAFYENEASVGHAIRDSGIDRSEIFVTSKVFGTDFGYDRAVAAGLLSNEKLGLGYINLYLMHSPEGKIVETYDALLELQKRGVVRSVGVSNFGVPHLEALANYGRCVPVVNQIEMHPLIFEERKDVVEYCKDKDILITAYGSVLSGHDDLLAKADSIASKYQKTEAQVFLRWGLQEHFQVIPKSTHTTWIYENKDIYDFSLSDTEMDELNSFQGDLGEYWNPLVWPVDLGDVSHGSADCPH
mmetsp:Transcript_109102/g.233158  ORF Transcript_109102/g.233158 Transcript_109102/m.233158 type:complete len:336 (-) Transcript_109102:40-1047(-)